METQQFLQMTDWNLFTGIVRAETTKGCNRNTEVQGTIIGPKPKENRETKSFASVAVGSSVTIRNFWTRLIVRKKIAMTIKLSIFCLLVDFNDTESVLSFTP